MEFKIFEQKLRAAISTNDYHEHAHLLPAVEPEKRSLFIEAIACGYSLAETIQLHSKGTLQPETILIAAQQKMQDSTSEIRA